MPLDEAIIAHIAALARIRLAPDELERMRRELDGILGWIAQLQEVDTEGVVPMAGGNPEAAAVMPMRDDVVDEGGVAETILANAPDREGDYFAVPKVVE